MFDFEDNKELVVSLMFLCRGDFGRHRFEVTKCDNAKPNAHCLDYFDNPAAADSP